MPTVPSREGRIIIRDFIFGSSSVDHFRITRKQGINLKTPVLLIYKTQGRVDLYPKYNGSTVGREGLKGLASGRKVCFKTNALVEMLPDHLER